MLENIYTTKMSAQKNMLQSRFAKIRSKSGCGSRLLAATVLAGILLIMAGASICIAARIPPGEYAMTEKEPAAVTRNDSQKGFGSGAGLPVDLTIPKAYTENAETAVRNFFSAFEKSDLNAMKPFVTNDFIAAGYFDDAYGLCYGMTSAKLETLSKANVDEFLKNYFTKPEHTLFTLSERDIETLRSESDEMAVYTVIVTAESNIKGESQPPFARFLNVICRKQENGSYFVHKLVS